MHAVGLMCGTRSRSWQREVHDLESAPRVVVPCSQVPTHAARPTRFPRTSRVTPTHRGQAGPRHVRTSRPPTATNCNQARSEGIHPATWHVRHRFPAASRRPWPIESRCHARGTHRLRLCTFAPKPPGTHGGCTRSVAHSSFAPTPDLSINSKNALMSAGNPPASLKSQQPSLRLFAQRDKASRRRPLNSRIGASRLARASSMHTRKKYRHVSGSLQRHHGLPSCTAARGTHTLIQDRSNPPRHVESTLFSFTNSCSTPPAHTHARVRACCTAHTRAAAASFARCLLG